MAYGNINIAVAMLPVLYKELAMVDGHRVPALLLRLLASCPAPCHAPSCAWLQHLNLLSGVV